MRRGPVVFERGEGSLLWDVDGNCYIDFAAGVLTNSTGNCHPRVVQKFIAQVKKLWHVHDNPTPERVKLLKILLNKTPEGIDTFEFYSGGSETVEAAMKAATSYTHKYEDMAYKSGPLISPKLFRQFILPYYKKLISYLKNIGIKNIWVDSDGNLQELIPLFLEGGVTGIFPFEVQAGNDVRKIHSDFPDKFMIVGGIDKRALSKDYGAIEQEVDRIMEYFKERRGYIPTLDHIVPPDVPLKNFQYYFEYLKQYNK